MAAVPGESVMDTTVRDPPAVSPVIAMTGSPPVQSRRPTRLSAKALTVDTISNSAHTLSLTATRP